MTDADFSDPLNPMFKLTCYSFNGPPTDVMWTRKVDRITHRVDYVNDDDYEHVQTVSNMLHMDYENELTVKGSKPGEYKCCVSNVRRSGVCSQTYILKG